MSDPTIRYWPRYGTGWLESPFAWWRGLVKRERDNVLLHNGPCFDRLWETFECLDEGCVCSCHKKERAAADRRGSDSAAVRSQSTGGTG